MSKERNSEKRGWILGWFGGFLWVLILAIVRLARGDFLPALVGSALVMAAAAVILASSPWRHPTRHYWRLMLPIYLLLFLSVAWLVWSAGGASELGLNTWSLFLLLPLLLPLYLAGKRRWIDGDRKDT
ncbi:MAG: hypothetical protein GTO14_20915 [Anaerolineales bacterium]|nr:hypothetical protein [Anaerolineales bacterium]